MRRIIPIAAAVATAGLAATTTAAEQTRIYAVPKVGRTVALPTPSRSAEIRRTGRAVAPSASIVSKPGSVGLYRDPIYSDGLVHPGFYRGFDRYGAILPRSYGGLSGGGYGGSLRSDTNVDVDVQTRQNGAAPVVVAPRGAPDRSAEIAALRRENWQLRRSLAPDLGPLGVAAAGTGKGTAELRELIGTIIARRDRQWQEKISGARVVAVDEYQRELGDARDDVRKLERRERNPHILYLGFED